MKKKNLDLSIDKPLKNFTDNIGPSKRFFHDFIIRALFVSPSSTKNKQTLPFSQPTAVRR